MSQDTAEPINPYKTPRAAIEFPRTTSSADVFRDGKFLVVRDRAQLPMRCLINGEVVTEDAWRKPKQISWTPPWILFGLLGGVLPILLLILITQKKAKVVYSLGRRAQSKIRNRQLMGSGFVVAAGLMFAAGISRLETGSMGGILIFFSIVVFILGLVVLGTTSPFKTCGYRKGWFKMKGVSQELLNELPEGNWKSI